MAIAEEGFDRPSGNRTAQLVCAWCGPAFTVLFALGGVIIGRLIPPFLHPSDSAEVFVTKVVDHLLSARIGAFIMMFAVCLMAPWGAGMAARTRRQEGDFPILSGAQLTCVGAGTAIAMLMAFFWALMCFRPTEYPPSLVQYSADLAYFMPLFSWPIFSFWCWIIALAILLDRSPQPDYPRWLAFFNLWAGFTYIPGGLILYMKTGPIAWDGALGLYLPFVAFFVWILVMSWATIKAIKASSPNSVD